MISNFHRQLDELRGQLLGMGLKVQTAIQDSALALATRDTDLAAQVIKRDRDVDLLENYIEEQAITLLATQQPMAGDLRLLTACIKISNALERMADQAVNLAQRAVALAAMEPMDPPALIARMAELAVEMTASCLRAFQQADVALCHELCDRDDDLDELNHRVFADMLDWMMREDRVVHRAMECVLAARHLEKIGDGATEIAEEVCLLVEGHRPGEPAGMQEGAPPNA